MNNKVIAIVGPTAVGKTDLSIEVAKKFNGEVISGDSMQIYIGMDTGTAKATKKEQQSVPHHMIDIISPKQSFSAQEFQERCVKKIKEIQSRNKLPIIVGGSGLYIQSVLFGYEFPEYARDDTKHSEYERISKEKGPMYLYGLLKEIDPVQAKEIHPNNMRRVIRALEIYHATGKTMSSLLKEQKLNVRTNFNVTLIGLEMSREELYERINTRVDKMIEGGLIEEIKELLSLGVKEDAQAFKAIGYKELLSSINGDTNFEESVSLLKRNSRRFAKRQYTWFKNKMDVQWYPATECTQVTHENILNDLTEVINGI